MTETIKSKLQELIQKYQRKSMIRTLEVIQDLQYIDKCLSQQTDQPKENTLLEDVQNTYLKKFGKIPARYKNDIKRLSSKL